MYYCTHCGAESSAALNYCKRCGTNLAQPARANEPMSVPAKLTGMFLLAMTLITLTGLMMAIIAPSELAHRSPTGLIAMIIVLSIVTAIGIDLLLVWLLLHLIKLSHKGFQFIESSVAPRPPVVHAPPQVAAPMAGVASVTEHTTRNFEHAADGVSSEQGQGVKQRATR